MARAKPALITRRDKSKRALSAILAKIFVADEEGEDAGDLFIVLAERNTGGDENGEGRPCMRTSVPFVSIKGE